jgi:putative flippase GtrA
VSAPVLDVVVPVHNEEAVLPHAVHRLHAHLVDTFPYPFVITVVDNASTDRTWEVTEDLSRSVPGIRLLRLPDKGRGRAVRLAWWTSNAPVLAYMDVDLSTDLDALWPLVAPLMSGHSDVAIGSRLARGARVIRGPRREVISRCYNLLLRVTLHARFTDAQCGFKAIRADVGRELLPLVEDPSWFFDTELLVLAERSRQRIHEVPVDWYDDPDSRVDVVSTAVDDLRGIRRLRRALRRGALPVDRVAERIGRGELRTGGPFGVLGGQVGRFAGVGAMSTAVHLGLFAAFTGVFTSAQVANVLALLTATVANTWANRRWTFGVGGREGALRHQAQGLAVFGLFWLMTAGALGVLGAVAPSAPTAVQTVVVGVANLAATVVKFLVMRRWTPSGRNQTTTRAQDEASDRFMAQYELDT